MTIRLSKFLAAAGVTSRRGAARLIEAGRVTLDNKIASHCDAVYPHSKVVVDGKLIDASGEKRYYAYHKPVGIDCRLLKNDPSSLLHQLPSALGLADDEIPRLYPAGRLDKDSRGLLLLSNDGELTHTLMHPDFNHLKGYLVTLNKVPEAKDISAIATGFDYGDGLTRPCRIERIKDCVPIQSMQQSFTTIGSHNADNTANAYQVRMWLTEGKKRQIRRVWRARGYQVIDLLRESIQHLSLGSLTEGRARLLTKDEVDALKDHTF